MSRPYNPSFTYTRYPYDFDDPTPGDQHGLPTVIDLKTPVRAEVVNRQRDAILAIESELGIKPSGTYTSVRARLDALELGVGDGYITVKHEGTTVVSRATAVNFTGTGVNVTASGDEAEVIITGGTVLDGYSTDGYYPIHEALPVLINGQTVFILSEIPWDGSLELFIDGIKQEIGDYSITGTSLTWTGSVTLNTSDVVEVYYSKLYKLAGSSDCCSTVMYQDSFIATAGQTNFILTHTPLDLNSTELFIDGLSATPITDYILDGYNLIYSDSPSLSGGEVILIKYFESICESEAPSYTGFHQETFTATAGQTGFELLYAPLNTNATEVFIDGISLTVSIDYSVTSNIVTYIESVENPALTGGEVVVIKYFENESFINSQNNLTLAEVLFFGNNANNLDIDNVNSLSAVDGYFSNQVTISGKLTVGGLIDPTGLVLDGQTSNPSTPESGKATLWYRNTDGYFVISNDVGDIVLNGTGTGGVNVPSDIEDGYVPIANNDGTVSYLSGINDGYVLTWDSTLHSWISKEIISNPDLEQVLTNGNDANNLDIIGLQSIYAVDGYFTNQVVINGKLTVDGLIDPIGLILDGQTSNPTTPEVGKATLWYHEDGYVVVSDSTGDTIVGSGGSSKTSTEADFDGYDIVDGYEYNLVLLTSGHDAGMYFIGCYVNVDTAADTGEITAKVVVGASEITFWAPQSVISTGPLFFPAISFYSDGTSDIELVFTWTDLTGSPMFKLRGSII